MSQRDLENDVISLVDLIRADMAKQQWAPVPNAKSIFQQDQQEESKTAPASPAVEQGKEPAPAAVEPVATPEE
jgi:hypothetical protein